MKMWQFLYLKPYFLGATLWIKAGPTSTPHHKSPRLWHDTTITSILPRGSTCWNVTVSQRDTLIQHHLRWNPPSGDVANSLTLLRKWNMSHSYFPCFISLTWGRLPSCFAAVSLVVTFQILLHLSTPDPMDFKSLSLSKVWFHHQK